MQNLHRLAEAVKAGDLDTAAALLQARPELIAMDMAGDDEHRVLHYAVLRRDPAMVRLLMRAGADPHKGIFPHRDATSAIALARDREYTDILAILESEQQPAPDAAAAPKPKPHDPARAAVEAGDLQRITELVRADPGLLTRNTDWRQGGLLSLAVRQGNVPILQFLLDLGADVDERTLLTELETPTESAGQPLWLAAQAGRHDLATLLLDRGANPNANLYASGWPLDHAYRNGDDAMKQLLLARGAKPQPWTVTLANDIDAARQMLAADSCEALAAELAWSAAANGCPEILALALPNLPWDRSDSRWHWILVQPPRSAAGEPHFECMARLLQHGVDPNVTQRFGQTVLHFIAARGTLTDSARLRFAVMLLDAGSRLDLRDELLQSTPLGWACRWGRKELAQLLISRGAPFDEPDAEPWATPAAWTAKYQPS